MSIMLMYMEQECIDPAVTRANLWLLVWSRLPDYTKSGRTFNVIATAGVDARGLSSWVALVLCQGYFQTRTLGAQFISRNSRNPLAVITRHNQV